MKNQGEIFEDQFELCGIEDNIQKKGKSIGELVIYRRCGIVLTSDEFFNREMQKIRDEVQRKEDIAKRRVEAAQKREQETERKIEQAQAKERDKANRVLAKETMKIAKERVRNQKNNENRKLLKKQKLTN